VLTFAAHAVAPRLNEFRAAHRELVDPSRNSMSITFGGTQVAKRLLGMIEPNWLGPALLVSEEAALHIVREHPRSTKLSLFITLAAT
jgi:hypothetical protein